MINEPTWRKSSYSGANANNCVELAVSTSEVGVRDTKNRHAGALRFPRQAFTTFLVHVADGVEVS